MTFLFWNRSKIHAHLLPLKVRHRNLNFELIYLNVYLDSCLFLGLNLIPIKHRHDISVLKSFNIGQHLFTSTQSASRKIEFLNCIMFIYLFIHSLIRIFFLLLFICFHLILIYINQVWHFCFWNRSKIHAHLLPLKVRHRNLELWIDLFKCIFR